MADEIKNNLDEHSGHTNFGGSANRAGTQYTPSGPIGRFFAKFFASPAQDEVVKAMDKGQVTPEGGDTVIQTSVIKDTGHFFIHEKLGQICMSNDSLSNTVRRFTQKWEFAQVDILD